MQLLRQLVGFILLVVFFVLLGFAHDVLDRLGAPGIISWPVAAIVGLVMIAVPFWGRERFQEWRFESKPGVKAWKQLDERAFGLQKKGDFAAAAPLFRQAIPLADATGQPIIVATAANNLAAVYIDQERWADARSLLQRAYELRKQALGDDNELTLATAERLSASEAAQGHWSETEALLRALLPVYVKKGGAESAAALEKMCQIGVACRHQGKYDEAARIYQDADRLVTGNKLTESEVAGTLYNDWAYALVASGSPAAAIPIYDRAIAIREHKRHTSPTELATSLDNRADAQAAVGDASGAAVTSQRWLEIMERFLEMHEAGHAMLVPVLEQHATRLGAASRQGEASALRERAEKIRREHPEEVAKLEKAMASVSDSP